MAPRGYSAWQAVKSRPAVSLCNVPSSRLLLRLQRTVQILLLGQGVLLSPFADRFKSYNPAPTVVQVSVACRSSPSTTQDEPGQLVHEVLSATHLTPTPSTRLNMLYAHIDTSKRPNQLLSLAQHLMLPPLQRLPPSTRFPPSYRPRDPPPLGLPHELLSTAKKILAPKEQAESKKFSHLGISTTALPVQSTAST